MNRPAEAVDQHDHGEGQEHATTTATSTTTTTITADGHDHGHDHGPHGHTHPHTHATGLKGWLQSVFVPHSHDAADSIDEALESSAQGIRAVKVSLLGLGATSLFQLVIVLISGSVALLADTVHNFSDALDRGAALDRVPAGPPQGHPDVHLRLRPGRGPRRAVHRGDDRPLRRGGRRRIDPPLLRTAARAQPRLGARRRAGGLRRQRTRRDLPDPGRPADRFRRPGGRRCPRPDGRLHLAGRRRRRHRHLARLPAGGPDRGPADFRRHRRPPVGHRARRRTAADGRRRPWADRAGRGRRRGTLPFRRHRPAALVRPPAARRDHGADPDGRAPG